MSRTLKIQQRNRANGPLNLPRHSPEVARQSNLTARGRSYGHTVGRMSLLATYGIVIRVTPPASADQERLPEVHHRHPPRPMGILLHPV